MGSPAVSGVERVGWREDGGSGRSGRVGKDWYVKSERKDLKKEIKKRNLQHNQIKQEEKKISVK